MFSCLHVGRVTRILNPNPHLWTFSQIFLTLSPVPAGIDPLQPGVRVSEDGLHHVRRGVSHSGHQCCDQQGRAPAVHQLFQYKTAQQRRHTKFIWPDAWLPFSVRYRQRLVRHLATLLLERAFLPFWQIQQIQIGIQSQQSQHHNKETANSQKEKWNQRVTVHFDMSSWGLSSFVIAISSTTYYQTYQNCCTRLLDNCEVGIHAVVVVEGAWVRGDSLAVGWTLWIGIHLNAVSFIDDDLICFRSNRCSIQSFKTL